MKAAMPGIRIAYGGVYPTYHALEILERHLEIDVIVRGEGEATAVRLVAALDSGEPLSEIPGIAFREGGVPHCTSRAGPIRVLDAFRVGWELIEDWDQYQYWGAGRAAVIQFSRGCPHRCNYCGQRDFWTRWRHRDPRRVAAEIGWLHRRHGVRFFDLADENPTSSRPAWEIFLDSVVAEAVPVQIVATIRASDIVRDADILGLYKKAGISRILMGVETPVPGIQASIGKDSSPAVDREAIRLLRRHDIISQVAYVVGFRRESDSDYLQGLLQLMSYDPDLINAMYATPHRWTPFYRENAGRGIVEMDPARWDYRHQVLDSGIPPWRVFLWVKLTEAILQLRPAALWRVIAHRDPAVRKALRWCYGVGRRAWMYEWASFLSPRKRSRGKPTLAEFWGAPQDGGEGDEGARPRASARRRQTVVTSGGSCQQAGYGGSGP